MFISSTLLSDREDTEDRKIEQMMCVNACSSVRVSECGSQSENSQDVIMHVSECISCVKSMQE
jgi:hypothetical protein